MLPNAPAGSSPTSSSASFDEQRGDKASACRHYGKVLERWATQASQRHGRRGPRPLRKARLPTLSVARPRPRHERVHRDRPHRNPPPTTKDAQVEERVFTTEVVLAAIKRANGNLTLAANLGY